MKSRNERDWKKMNDIIETLLSITLFLLALSVIIILGILIYLMVTVGVKY